MTKANELIQTGFEEIPKVVEVLSQTKATDTQHTQQKPYGNLLIFFFQVYCSNTNSFGL